MGDLPEFVDHLVYATPDVEASVEALEERLGARAIEGGRHAAWGTRNALLSLGAATYLEIVGPDPEAAPAFPRPFGLSEPGPPRFATWAACVADFDALVERATRAGVDLGERFERSRLRPDGSKLSWRMTDPLASRMDGLLPFLIDWGTSPHPALSAPSAGRLRVLRAEHPDPKPIRAALARLGWSMEVATGSVPALVATLETARGIVELR
jgi:catechol 2,3-dioxygenase-like lactoylglutathione lyase family enzyme